MSSNIRIVAELEDKLSKDLRKLASDTSKELSAISSKLKDAQTQFAQLGRGKADASRRAELNATITDLKRERAEVQKNEKAEERRYKNTFAYEREKRLEVAKTTNQVVASSHQEVQAKEKVTHGNYKEDASRRAATTSLVRHIRQLESLAVAYYAISQTYDKTVGQGVTLLRQYESQSLGIAAILASKSSLIKANGEEATSYENLKSAQILTKDIMSDIKKAAIDTPASFGEMVGFYQQAIGHAMASSDAFGGSIEKVSENTIKFTQRMSNLGSSVGMSMDRIDEEIRSLIGGNASADSQLAKLLFGSPAAANEAIKEAKKRTNGLSELFDQVFGSFDVLAKENTFDKSLARVSAAIDEIRMGAAKPVFDDMFASLIDIEQYLQANGKDIAETFRDTYEVVKALVSVLDEAAIAMGSYYVVSRSAMAIEAIRASLIATNTTAVVANTSAETLRTAITMSSTTAMRGQTVAQVALNTATTAFSKIPIGAVIGGAAALIAVGASAIVDNANDLRQAIKGIRIETEKLSLGAINARIAMEEAKLQSNSDKMNNPSLAKKLFGNSRYELYEDRNIKRNLQDLYSRKEQLDAIEETDKVKKLQDQLKSLEQAKKGLLKIHQSTAKVDEAIAKTKAQLNTAGGTRIIKNEGGSEGSGTPKTPKGAKTPKGDGGYAESIQSLNDAGYAFSLEVMANDDKATSDKVDSINKQRQALLSYYEAVGNKQDAFYMNLGDELSNLAGVAGITDEMLQNVFNVRTDEFQKSLEKVKPEVDKIKDETMKLSTVFEDAFKSMEDSMVDMFMTGKFNAEDFFNTIIEGIIRMQIRNSITQPLTTAVSGADFGSMFSAAGSSIMSWLASANGNAFIGGQPVHAFANGGAFTNSIVNKPTLAPMALFGEAGAEAIMPLTRDGSGKLGVNAQGMGGTNVVVNIENNSGTPVSQDNVSTSFDGGSMVVNIVLDAITRNKGGMRDAVRSVR